MERESRAYNDSIYLMVGMPYLLLGGVGLLIYRAVRQKERAIDEGGGPSGGPPRRRKRRTRPCSAPSPVGPF